MCESMPYRLALTGFDYPNSQLNAFEMREDRVVVAALLSFILSRRRRREDEEP